MSELIVEMEMPERCGACKCRHVEIGRDYFAVFCTIKDNEYVEDADSRPSWCPIKGVLPEEHGDLVDADAIYERAGQKKGEADPLALVRELWSAPVIIAAERKDVDK